MLIDYTQWLSEQTYDRNNDWTKERTLAEFASTLEMNTTQSVTMET